MKLIPSLSFVALVLICCAAKADPKARKPTVCESFEVVVDAAKAKATGKTMLGVCRDGKKPRLFTYWTPVVVEDESGSRRYVVGG